MDHTLHDAPADDSFADASFDELVCRIVGQVEAGQRIDLTAIEVECPAHAERLRQLLPALEAAAALGEAVPRTSAGISRSANGMHTLGPTAGILGDFRIVREIGRGGMGVVYEAEQLSLGRRVALKVLPFAALLDRQQLARFKNEARAAATLDHPNIVAVHSVGSERGVNFYAMQYIDGRSMAEIIGELRRAMQPASHDPSATQDFDGVTKALVAGEFAPKLVVDEKQPAPASKSSLPLARGATGASDTRRELQAGISTWPGTQSRDYFRTVAGLGIQAAEALDHAHQHGILHRDVKPGNLLIDDTGKLWVTDFGLARIEAEAGMTMTGDLLGTLRYMSPEQALAKRVVVDHRSDIYSLGATLYELLTLQPAYPATDRQELLRQIAFEEPRRPRQINRNIPVDLETIVGKALEKNPADRYATARDLADDFRRFLATEPIRAKPASLLQRLGKWSRRHVAIVWSAAAAMLLSTVVLLVASVQVGKWYREAERQREFANLQLEEVQRQQEATRAAEQKEAEIRAQIERDEYGQNIALAEELLQRAQIGSLQELLDRYVPRAGQKDLRGWEWYYYLSKCHEGWRTLYGHAGKVESVAWSPDGKYLATGGTDGTIILWDVPGGHIHKTLDEAGDGITSLGWSPDGRLLASGQWGGKVRIWDAATWAVIKIIRDSDESHINQVSWSRDGKYIATCQYGGGIKVRDADSGDVVQTISGQPLQTPYFEWSPDSQYIAYRSVIDEKAVVRLWDIKLGRNSNTLQGKSGYGRPAWSPDGKTLAIDGRDGAVILYNPFTGEELQRLSGDPPPDRALWSPDGKQIAAPVDGGANQRVWVWSLGDPSHPIQSPPTFFGDMIRTAWCWSPDGRFLASGGNGGLVKIWAVPKVESELAAGAEMVWQAWSPDGTQSVNVGRDGAMRLYSSSGQLIRALPKYDSVKKIAWRHDGKFVAVGMAGRVVVCDVSTAEEVSRITIEGKVSDIAWSNDGSSLAVLTAPGDIFTIWNPREQRLIAQVPGGRKALASTALNDLMIAAGRECFDLIDPKSGKIVAALKIPAEAPMKRIDAVEWNPDATLIAAAAENSVWLSDPSTQQPIRVLRGHKERVRSVAWRPDEQQLATASATEVCIWNVSGEQPVAIIRGEFGTSPELDWYPDGTKIGLFSADRSKLFDATKGYELALSDEYQFERAHRLAAVGEQDGAVSLLKQLAKEHPENDQYASAWRRHAIEAHLAKAGQHESKKQWKQAIADLDNALSQLPGNQRLLTRRAAILYSNKEYDRALSEADRLVELDPNSATAWNLRGCCHGQLDRLSEALSDFDRAIELSPNTRSMVTNRITVLMRLNRQEEALAALDAAMAMAPNDPGFPNDLAWVLATASHDEVRNGQRAIELATKACELTGYKDFQYVDTLAAAYAEAGDFQKAVEWQQKAVSLASAGSEIYKELVARLEAFRRHEPWREE